jgi:hypothetical protein
VKEIMVSVKKNERHVLASWSDELANIKL